MLKKLLKYDFKSVFRYWWIAALISLILSFGAGGAIQVLLLEKTVPMIVTLLSVLVIVLVIVSYLVLSILSIILVFTRFYKNFFTDEGYLTFTLPVKRSQLLNSKLILSVTTLFATTIMCIIDILVMLCIGFADVVFTKGFWNEFGNIFSYLMDLLKDTAGWYLLIYIVELLLLCVLSFVFSSLFLFCCITFASIITKKAKVITAIGIYYAANGIYSFVLQILYAFGIPSIMYWLSDQPDNVIARAIAIIALGLLLFIAIFCAMLYTLQYWMIDRKLNLS